MRLIFILSILIAVSCRGHTDTPVVNKEYVQRCVIIAERIVRDTLHFDNLGKLHKGIIDIERDVDLKGNACKVPAGVTLSLKGGKIRNGVLIGNETKIKGKGKVFDRVTIKGTWNVPYISTSIFESLDYDNSLRDVVALASPNVKNTIVIGKGKYRVSARKNNDVCIPLCSNTDLKLQGTVRLAPNGFKHYNIIQVQGENIRITGNGAVIGDKLSHTGTEGEWGMGIRFHKAIKASVSGLAIKDCWGDCIYVGGKSKNVLIEKCRIDNGRRQGISVTKADSVIIRQCLITNVSGTNPQYAIDVEPNSGDSVSNVIIENVETKGCEGGFLLVRSGALKDGKPVSWIGNVTIKNCTVSAKSKYPMRLYRCEDLSVEGCKVYSTNAYPAILVCEVGNACIIGNTITQEKHIISSIKNVAKKVAGRKDVNPISMIKVEKQDVKNNTIIEN